MQAERDMAGSGVSASAVTGLIGGLALFAVAIATTATDPWSFLNWPSAVIVLGGTLAAALISHSFAELRQAFARFWSLLRRESVVDHQDAERFIQVARLLKAGKLKIIEEEIAAVRSPLVRTGLRLLVDGMPGDGIGIVLDWRIRQQEANERGDAAIFRAMASYAPAFGMAGTIIGLVNMLRMMGDGATPEQIGSNLAFALITTLYGLIFANLLLKPIAAKIEKKAYEHVRVMATVAEAFREIGGGHGPSHVREMLAALSERHTAEMNNADTFQAQSLDEQDVPGGTK